MKSIKLIASGITILLSLSSANVFARTEGGESIKDTITRETPKEVVESGWDLGSGWRIGTFGGLSYVNPDNKCHWFKLSGVLRVDETLFMGSYRDKQNDFPSGGNLRTAQISGEGGIGLNWEYAIGLDLTATISERLLNGATRTRQNGVALTDTWIAYSGFNDHNQVFIGQISGNWFGYENATSSSWMPFLERSLQANAFYPGDGLGVMTDFWWDTGDITFIALQPSQGDLQIDSSNRDHWLAISRLTYSPIYCTGDVWHFGVSAAWWEAKTDYKGLPFADPGNEFSSRPEARARRTTKLVDTDHIRANYSTEYNVEIARQIGPFIIAGEYTTAYAHRVGDPLGSLHFHGWNTQASYVLTGEVHEYDVRDGNFGTIKPCGEYGAFEVAIRYDFLNLNSKNLLGGSEHNVSLGLNWYVNNNVRLSANYVHASIHPSLVGRPLALAFKRNLDIFAVRAQVRFK